MAKTVTGTIRIKGQSAVFLRDRQPDAPLKIAPWKRYKYGFLDGDRLEASLRADRRGRLEVIPLRIIERAFTGFVGVVDQDKGRLVVVPFNRPALPTFLLADDAESDQQPRPGEAVEVQITAYPADNEPGKVVVTKRLGDFRAPGVDIRVVASRYGLSRRFPRGCRQEARKLAQPVGKQDLHHRTDLRQKNFVTIDGASARDFDDAVTVDRLPNGGYRLYVSIADVSHYVRPGSLLDREAYRRGTSIYFPDYCLPMLPEELSNGICSLRPGEDRLTLTVIMEFDRRGKRTGESFCPSVINSKARLTYDLVADILEGRRQGRQIPQRCRPLVPELKLMHELSRLLRRQRRQRGSIDFDLPDVDLVLDQRGNIEKIKPAEHNVAHQLVEEFMLAANETVATRLSWLEAPLLYRIHEPPETKKINQLVDILQCFGLAVKGRQAIHPRAFQELLQQVENTPAAPVINKILLQVMQRARYSPVNAGHFGLALEYYTHFTSPIRRYPDLLVHRVLKAALWPAKEKKKPEVFTVDWEKAGEELSERERAAQEAERCALKLKKLFYLEKQPDASFPGLVAGISEAGLFITLDTLLLDGLLPFRYFDDFYQLKENRLQAVGEPGGRVFTIGDQLQVAVDQIDPVRCRLDFRPASQKKKPRPGNPARSRNHHHRRRSLATRRRR
ncbi:MAG: ribonuclease R [Deltaproteobacteria bacterium]|nr:ribonuclease R [Deltaproteobacteria bacterium]